MLEPAGNCFSFNINWDGKFSIMNSSLERKEAAHALDQIEQAQASGRAISTYRDSAPHFILWGLTWFVANSVTEVSLAAGLVAWPVAGAVAAVASNQMAKRLRRRRNSREGSQRKIDWHAGACFSLLFVFVILTGFVFAPVSYRELSAFISLIAAFAYMAAGIWLGTQLFVIGALTALLILAGYFGLKDYYYLWLGVVGGGALIAGGLWLRKA